MKKKLVAGFMAATMMASVMSTGVFAKDLDPSDENKKAGDTQVTATVGENENKASYVCLLYTSELITGWRIHFRRIKVPGILFQKMEWKSSSLTCRSLHAQPTGFR